MQPTEEDVENFLGPPVWSLAKVCSSLRPKDVRARQQEHGLGRLGKGLCFRECLAGIHCELSWT